MEYKFRPLRADEIDCRENNKRKLAVTIALQRRKS